MESSDLLDLAALCALDTLEDHEQEWFEGKLAGSSDLQAELIAFQAAVAAIPYSAPLLPVAPDLKARLFERIATDSSADLPTDLPEQERCADVSIEELWGRANQVTWEDYAPAPGALLGVFNVDEETRRVQCFVKSQGRARFPAHRHATDEEIVVLQGDLLLDGKVYGSGDRIISEPGTVHQPETLNGCVLFLTTSMDDEILADR